MLKNLLFGLTSLTQFTAIKISWHILQEVWHDHHPRSANRTPSRHIQDPFRLRAKRSRASYGANRHRSSDRLGRNTLLAIKDNGKFLFPSWQFDPTGPDGVLEGFPQVLKALAMSDYAKLNWLTRPNPYLEGLTPVEALKRGQSDRVIQQAEAAEASQWC